MWILLVYIQSMVSARNMNVIWENHYEDYVDGIKEF